MNLSLIARTSVAVAGTALMVLPTSAALAAPTDQLVTTASASTASSGTAVTATDRPSAQAEALLERRGSNDGVKGKIKNYAGYPVKITFNNTQTRVLNADDDVTYYSGQYAVVKMSRLDGTHEVKLQLTDNVIKQPRTLFYPNAADSSQYTYRTGWAEGDSHHEIWGDTKLWVKRETDGWNGGHETRATSDWQVFTVHIDSLQK